MATLPVHAQTTKTSKRGGTGTTTKSTSKGTTTVNGTGTGAKGGTASGTASYGKGKASASGTATGRKGRTATREYALPQPLAPFRGRAWVVAFGVNAYEAPRWNLHYAAADARAFGKNLVPHRQGTGQYAAVTFVPLVSDTGAGNPAELPATKAALRAVLNALAGRQDSQDAPFLPLLRKLGVTRAAPEDMVLLAFSCHGDTDLKTGEYYLFPADIGPNQSGGLTAGLKARSISSAELTRWMQDVDAGAMAMVIDSCHSAAVAGQGYKGGPMDSAGLGQLAYYKRMRVLSASQADVAAKEYKSLGHGLLTAALLKDGLGVEGAKPAPGQALLTLGPWLKFAVGDVTQLDRRENGGKSPGRKGVAAAEVGSESGDAGFQKPHLFYFLLPGMPDAPVSRGPVNAGKAR